MEAQKPELKERKQKKTFVRSLIFDNLSMMGFFVPRKKSMGDGCYRNPCIR